MALGIAVSFTSEMATFTAHDIVDSFIFETIISMVQGNQASGTYETTTFMGRVRGTHRFSTKAGVPPGKVELCG
jgi:hypothetical protein